MAGLLPRMVSGPAPVRVWIDEKLSFSPGHPFRAVVGVQHEVLHRSVRLADPDDEDPVVLGYPVPATGKTPAGLPSAYEIFGHPGSLMRL